MGTLKPCREPEKQPKIEFRCGSSDLPGQSHLKIFTLARAGKQYKNLLIFGHSRQSARKTCSKWYKLAAKNPNAIALLIFLMIDSIFHL